VGIAGIGNGRAGVFDLGEGEEAVAFEGEVISHQLSAISKKERVVSHQLSVVQLKELFERRGRQIDLKKVTPERESASDGCAWWAE